MTTGSLSRQKLLTRKYKMNSLKQKSIRKSVAAVLVIGMILSMIFLLPTLSFAQESLAAEENKEILIKDIEKKNYPDTDIYINFNEDSYLGSIELTEEDFLLKENGTVIHDFILSKIGQTLEPVGIVLLVDTSGSMRGDPIQDATDSCSLIVDKMNENDLVSIIGFSSDIMVYSEFSSDKEALASSIADIKADGSTSLFDAIIAGAEQFQKLEDVRHRYLIVLSDGNDTASHAALEDAITKSLEYHVTVYSIALLSKDFDPSDIEKISQSTGGQLLTTFDSEDLVVLYSQISEKIRNQYVLSFISQDTGAQEIQLKISVARAGYASLVETSYANPVYVPSEDQIGHTQSLVQLETNNLESDFFIDILWIKLAIYVLVFVSVTVFMYAISTTMVPGKQELKTKTDNYINSSLYNKTKINDEEKDREKIFTRLANLITKITAKRGFVQLFEIKLKRAGMSIKAAEFMLWHIISVVIVTLLVFLITNNFFITLLTVMIVIFVPFILINFKTAQRIKKFNEQLPDTLQLIEGALKAGYSLNQSLVMVVKESKPPISEEFNIALSEIRMGLPEKDAMDNVANRISSELFTWVITAINIQREVGGNLAEIMGIIANTIRDREKVLRQIKSLTAEGKLSAYVLIGLPIIMGLVLSVMNREYVGLLFSTTLGLVMITAAALMMVAGIIWILKIIKIDY
jgi:tight adherence protein B